MRRVVYLAIAVALAGLAPSVLGQNGDARQVVRQKLAGEFALTKTTADRTDIVTAGSVVVLHKDGLLMYATQTSAPPTNTYKGGKMSHNLWPKCPGILSSYCGSLPEEPVKRTFVAGEKFWVTGIDLQSDAVTFSFYSDAINDVRYYGRLKIQLPKGQAVSAEDELRTIGQVITSESADDATRNPPPPPTEPARASVTASLAPIAPPPPVDAPAPAPKEIAVGQTREQVVANFGQPQKVVKLPTKELDYYSDMKVTYISGKVSTVDELLTQDASARARQ